MACLSGTEINAKIIPNKSSTGQWWVVNKSHQVARLWGRSRGTDLLALDMEELRLNAEALDGALALQSPVPAFCLSMCTVGRPVD